MSETTAKGKPTFWKCQKYDPYAHKRCEKFNNIEKTDCYTCGRGHGKADLALDENKDQIGTYTSMHEVEYDCGEDRIAGGKGSRHAFKLPTLAESPLTRFSCT